MRTALLLTVIFVACAAAAQTATASRQNSASAAPAIVTTDQSSTQHSEARAPESDRLSSTCYTMRSYIFRRQDGDAPRLVGMTKCTPANRFTTKRALKSPAWGVYPLGSGAAPTVEREH